MLRVDSYFIKVERWINLNEYVASKFNFTSDQELTLPQSSSSLLLNHNLKLENDYNKSYNLEKCHISMIHPTQIPDAGLLCASIEQDIHTINEFESRQNLPARINKFDHSIVQCESTPSFGEKHNENETTEFQTTSVTPQSKKDETGWDDLPFSNLIKSSPGSKQSSETKKKIRFQMDSKTAQIEAAKILNTVQASVLEDMKKIELC